MRTSSESRDVGSIRAGRTSVADADGLEEVLCRQVTEQIPADWNGTTLSCGDFAHRQGTISYGKTGSARTRRTDSDCYLVASNLPG
jgi:hypothetical protein